eukprot:snap_masked-scaffold_10-processed-gene-2.12-mRNA-1 protein AED:1.00 eAED:1.00 QI:0/-1/0/0/-1/1/1/0/508
MFSSLKRTRTKVATQKLRGFANTEVARQGNNSSSVSNLNSFLNFENSYTEKPRTPVLLITDIGADIDDTLALLTLLSCDLLEIKAIVTSVGNGEERGRLTRGWLRKLRLPDSLPIFPHSDNIGAACSVPENFPSIEESNLGKVEETPKNILSLCREIKREYGKKLIVIGIAALTPLWKAIKLDEKNDILKTVKKVYLQGNVQVEEGRLRAFDKAYNFRNDMIAADGVLNYFQDTTPITFLGKNAAYKINIRKENFKYWNNVIETSDINRQRTTEYKDVGKVDLLDMAYKQMNGFRLGDKSYFAKIYPDSKEYLDDDSLLFFFQMPDSGVLSHPYDPLLALSCIEDLENEEQENNLNNTLLRRVKTEIPFPRSSSLKIIEKNKKERKITRAFRGFKKRSQEAKNMIGKKSFQNIFSDDNKEKKQRKGGSVARNLFQQKKKSTDRTHLFNRKIIWVNGIKHEGIGNDGVHPEGIPNVEVTHARLIEAVGAGLQLNAAIREDLSWASFSSL